MPTPTSRTVESTARKQRFTDLPTAASGNPTPWWWTTREITEIRDRLDAGHGLDGLDPVRFGVALSLLPIDHPLIVAAALAVDVATTRHTDRIAHRDISHDIAGAADWRRNAANHLPYDVLAARRARPHYPPGRTPFEPARTDPPAPARQESA